MFKFRITVDDETINNETVTVRNRDTMEQITLPISELKLVFTAMAKDK